MARCFVISRSVVTRCARCVPVLLPAALLLAIALGPRAHDAAAKPRSRAVERSWVSPDFASLPLRKIALLPAVTYDGNHDASRAAPAVWLNAALRTGYQWIPAEKVRLALATASRQRDSLLEAINGQVQRTGRVDAVTARTIGRLTDAQGVLCLRVDKWLTASSPSSREMATVGLSAVLVDTEGRELWKIAGSATHEGAVVPRAFTDATPREAAPTAGLSAPTSSSSSGGSSGGSGQGEGSGGSSGGSGSGSGSGSGGSSGGSGSSGGTGGSASASGGSGAQMPSTRPDPATTRALQRDLYVANVATVYQGALTDIYAEWLPLLPAPPGSAAEAPAARDTTRR